MVEKKSMFTDGNLVEDIGVEESEMWIKPCQPY